MPSCSPPREVSAPAAPGQVATSLVAATPAIQRAALHRLIRDPGTALRRVLHAGVQARDYAALRALQRTEAIAKRRHRELLFDDRQGEANALLRRRLDLLPRVPELQLPTLWIRGAADRVVRDGQIATAARRSGGDLIQIPEAGHLVPLDQPEQCDAVVADFLAGR